MPERLATAEFAVNKKVCLAIKVLSFMANYSRELRIGADIRRRRKIEKTTEFTERIEKIQEEAGVALRKIQEETKR